MTDSFLINVAPGHLKMEMASSWLEQLLAHINANGVGDRTLEASMRQRLRDIDAEFAHLQAKLNKWAAAHAVDIVWTDTPGRRTYKRNYRVVLEADRRQHPNPSAVYDALDAEIRRLILEAPC
jgi:hypothetical protein